MAYHFVQASRERGLAVLNTTFDLTIFFKPGRLDADQLVLMVVDFSIIDGQIQLADEGAYRAGPDHNGLSDKNWLVHAFMGVAAKRDIDFGNVSGELHGGSQAGVIDQHHQIRLFFLLQVLNELPKAVDSRSVQSFKFSENAGTINALPIPRCSHIYLQSIERRNNGFSFRPGGRYGNLKGVTAFHCEHRARR